MDSFRIFDSTLEEVDTGELRAASQGALRASALGSCVAVVLYDPSARIGGLAHIMLPGRARLPHDRLHTRFAEDGIQELLNELEALGANPRELIACAAGGANVLHRPDDTVCAANIASVLETIEQLDIPLLASHLGGVERRTLSIVLASGQVWLTIADSTPRILWQPFCFDATHLSLDER
ncbi:MAG: chemotaxis protein CheD [Myxococcota bacterium]|jgi:chemotaxis protein CheD|nr:chemotaxis protein CheD [Myxococcota bacterium]